jgi:hypothetical protein
MYWATFTLRPGSYIQDRDAPVALARSDQKGSLVVFGFALTILTENYRGFSGVWRHRFSASIFTDLIQPLNLCGKFRLHFLHFVRTLCAKRPL